MVKCTKYYDILEVHHSATEHELKKGNYIHFLNHIVKLIIYFFN